MECPLLRSGVAAATLALHAKPEASPVKSEAAKQDDEAKGEDAKSEPVPDLALFHFLIVTNKKRKLFFAVHLCPTL